MLEPELILKSTPPRLPRSALERPRFARMWEEVRERTAVGVIAPAGFGKTTLLLQWRRLWLQHGGAVAWLTVDAQDEPARFALGLLHSLRHATGHAAFARLAAGCAAQPERQVEAMTALLAEVAQIGLETVLMLDDAERLPEPSAHLLAYLLHNAPPNLHLLVGSRRPLAIVIAELVAKGGVVILRSEELRLQPEESFAILQRRFGGRIGLDDCAHLHQACEGWPIGLQLACASIERAPDLPAAVRSMSGRHADLADYFLQSLYAQLPAELAEFLVQVSILERMNVELCEALTGCGSAREYLERVMLDTPFLSAAEGEDWMRLHPLARDFLLARFEALPLETREIFHCRAYHWFARRDRFHEAASHALAAGDLSATQAHAARSLWTLGTQGRLAEARAWLEQIPAQTLHEDVELRLVAAWIMVFGERNGEALRISQAVLADPASTPRTRVIASRVAAAAAAYADRLGLLPGIFRDWPGVEAGPPDPIYVVSGRNARSVWELHRGATAKVREISGAPAPEGDSLPLALAFSRALLALAHLWEGDLARVEETLRGALAEADREGGRRGMVPSLFAPILAAALQQRGQHTAALAMLADRLDVVERVSLPDAILLAYLTLSKASLGLGDERRALQVLEDLEDFALRRGLPRLLAHSLAERVRLHAWRQRPEAAEALLDRLDTLAARFDEADFAPFEPQFHLLLATARGSVVLARAQAEAAAAQLAEAEGLAAQLGRARDQLALKLLRVELARQRGDAGAHALLQEVLDLAALRGDRTLLAEAPPVLQAMEGAGQAARQESAAKMVEAGTDSMPLVVGGLLTPKEAHVLGLLSQGLSNKLIARAMEISDETVKWHLKNLFAKLSAGSRKHAVGRARLLGLIPG